MGARETSDSERVLRERVQYSAGIVGGFWGPVTSVGDGHGDVEVLQSIDIDVGGRCPGGKIGDSVGGGCSGDGSDTGDEDGEGSTKGRGEH